MCLLYQEIAEEGRLAFLREAEQARTAAVAGTRRWWRRRRARRRLSRAFQPEIVACRRVAAA